jgi:iron-sulfur cluster assembly accessory protein
MMSNFSPRDDQPILFTPAAVRAALAGLKEYGDDADFIRVTMIQAGALSPQYCLDFESKLRPGDVVMDFDALTVVVGTESAQRLRGTVIDHVEPPSGTGFKFHNPNTTR